MILQDIKTKFKPVFSILNITNDTNGEQQQIHLDHTNSDLVIFSIISCTLSKLIKLFRTGFINQEKIKLHQLTSEGESHIIQLLRKKKGVTTGFSENEFLTVDLSNRHILYTTVIWPYNDSNVASVMREVTQKLISIRERKRFRDDLLGKRFFGNYSASRLILKEHERMEIRLATLSRLMDNVIEPEPNGFPYDDSNDS